MSWGEHGVGPREDPWAIRVCCSVHHVVVPALNDCTPDLRRVSLADRRWGGEVVLGGVEAGGAAGGIAVWCGGALPLLWVVWVRRVVVLRWGPSEACGPFVVVRVCVVCQGLGSLHGRDPDALVVRLLASPLEDEVHDGLMEAFPRGDEVPKGLDGEFGPSILQAVPAKGGVQGFALEGCVEEVGVANGGRREGGMLRVRGGLPGWAAEVRCVYVDVGAFFSECSWSRRCRMVLWA